MSETRPGWYDYPGKPGFARYWDGRDWQGELRPRPSPPPAPVEPPASIPAANQPRVHPGYSDAERAAQRFARRRQIAVPSEAGRNAVSLTLGALGMLSILGGGAGGLVVLMNSSDEAEAVAGLWVLVSGVLSGALLLGAAQAITYMKASAAYLHDLASRES